MVELLCRKFTALGHNVVMATEMPDGGAVILNAFDDATFGPAPDWAETDSDEVFLGRLVSQNGCDTLIEALGRLADRGHRAGLTVIGHGPERDALDRQAVAASAAGQVRFMGCMKGLALAEEVSRHRVMVVPSRYEEPLGIVALEGLVCGCVPVGSERGGLTDAISGHEVTFANGDASALAGRLEAVLADMGAARARLDGVETHLAGCRARAVAERYIAVLECHLERRV